MNAKIYQAANSLSDEELAADRKAFFGSILGTLNHLVAGDTVWLKRFATHPANYLALEPIRQLPAPRNLNELLFSSIRELSAHRVWLDQVIVEWSRSITEADLDHILKYSSMRGVPADKNFYGLVMHFFIHQTHHRGQVTTLLSQAGVDTGDTGLLTVRFIWQGRHRQDQRRITGGKEFERLKESAAQRPPPASADGFPGRSTDPCQPRR